MPRVSKTKRCPRYEPPATGPTSTANLFYLWSDAETVRLITFLLHSNELPAQAFELRPGEFVTDPDVWLERIRQDVAAGPHGPRAKTRALQQDLERLRQLFSKPVAYRGASIPQRPKPT